MRWYSRGTPGGKKKLQRSMRSAIAGGPDHRYIKVRGNDGAVYILRHDEPADGWEIVVITREP